MPTEHTSRASIDVSHHSAIDIELKYLKLLSRRLQSALTIHATELQILQRLYYKNKNQHRGSLFWRNAAELRRYSEGLERLYIYDSFNALRCTFHGAAANTNSMKGPWTHFPSDKYLSDLITCYETAFKFAEKMSEVCLRAYQSFHCSLQSAAFLQILLMLVAISSRMYMVSVELQEILRQANTCISRLLSQQTDSQKPISHSVAEILSPTLRQGSLAIDSEMPDGSTFREQTQAYLTLSLSAPIVVERKGSSQALIERHKRTPDSTSTQKKKRRKGPRNEIDDIFGF